jgi:hypothetical protein
MTIPNTFHFIFGFQEDFGSKPFSLVHYLAVKSALHINQPKSVNFYFKYRPNGIWFEKLLPYINSIPVEPPISVFNRPLYHYAHQADVFRLQVLLEHGGIYMDLDTICRKPFTPLLHHSCVVGVQGIEEGPYGLCNGVLLAEPKSEFLQLWYEEYRNFRSTGRDQFWDEHSVKIPLALSRLFPNLVHVEPYTSFHDPFPWEQLDRLFIRNYEFPKAYCHHLWETVTWDTYLSCLTEQGIRSGQNTYSLLAKRFL